MTVSTTAEAHVLAGKLTAFGIRTMVRTDDVGGLESHFQLSNGVAIFVEAEDLQAAQSLLNDEQLPDDEQRVD